MPEQRVTVFEAVNDTLCEIYVGLTALTMNQVVTKHRGSPPPEIKHWLPGHAVYYRSVQFSIAASHAGEFAAEHAVSLRRPGWTIITAAGTGKR